MAIREPAFGLSEQGIQTSATLNWNLGTSQLVEQAVCRGEGILAKDGPLVVKTGKPVSYTHLTLPTTERV